MWSRLLRRSCGSLATGPAWGLAHSACGAAAAGLPAVLPSVHTHDSSLCVWGRFFFSLQSEMVALYIRSSSGSSAASNGVLG